MTTPDQTTQSNQATQANQPEHIVVVVEENHDADQIIGNPNAAYINKVLLANGLYYSNAHGTDHPSQPNYLELFAGANPGIPGINSPLQQHYPVGTENTPAGQNALSTGDNYNIGQPFSIANLGAALLAAGKTFTGYSEDLPSVGFTGQSASGPQGPNAYVEKHNPWAQFQGTGANQLPADTNQPLSAFPSNSDFSSLPTVSFVVPNQYNDMHNTVSAEGLPAVGTTGLDKNGQPVNGSTTIQNGDTWLANNLDAYRQWATTHNSLLVTVWDENDYDFTNANDIPMIVDGDPRLVQPGVNSSYVNHFDLLRTIEQAEGTQLSGLAASANGLATNANGTLVPDSTNEANFASSTTGIAADLLTRQVFTHGGPMTPLSPDANAITGSAKSDSFIAGPGAGNWTIDGGGGHDSLTIAADYSQSVVAPDQAGGFTVILDGSIIHATGIDRLKFLDGTMNFAGKHPGDFHPYSASDVTGDGAASGSGLGWMGNAAGQALLDMFANPATAQSGGGISPAVTTGAGASMASDLEAWLIAALPANHHGQ